HGCREPASEQESANGRSRLRRTVLVEHAGRDALRPVARIGVGRGSGSEWENELWLCRSLRLQRHERTRALSHRELHGPRWQADPQPVTYGARPEGYAGGPAEQLGPR